MKNTLLATLVAFLFLTSCTQQNTPSPSNNNNGGGNTTGYTVDQSYFFKINFQNKALYNYAVFSTIPPTGFLSGPMVSTLSTNTTNGVVSTDFWFASTLENLYITNANCKAVLSLKKPGNATGIYSKSAAAQIQDLTTAKLYNLDTSSINFNVSNVGLHNVTGTFTCKLIDGTTLIPASGSFNLYKQ